MRSQVNEGRILGSVPAEAGPAAVARAAWSAKTLDLGAPRRRVARVVPCHHPTLQSLSTLPVPAEVFLLGSMSSFIQNEM